jgi:hypothetical protein
VPGEPFVDYQIDWRNRCFVCDTLFLNYANGNLGYFPTLHAASPEYNATNTATYVSPTRAPSSTALVRITRCWGG